MNQPFSSRPAAPGPDPKASPSVSVVVPTCAGGDLLFALLAAVQGQTLTPQEIILVDSGSPRNELDRLRDRARVVEIPPHCFDHGKTRDLGAAAATGDIVAFVNQDAVPAAPSWLERLVSPFLGPNPPAAVQGAILEWPVGLLEAIGRRRFFWDSCGPRFYFTGESEGWIARHGGIGFSTVNCAIARWAWRELPFGQAAILEDKLWQGRATRRGWRIDEVPEAAVWHTHDYDVPGLARRCSNEGIGWRLVGESYRLRDAWYDLRYRFDWREWRRARRTMDLHPAELLFPMIRPLALWWGNRFSTQLR